MYYITTNSKVGSLFLCCICCTLFQCFFMFLVLDCPLPSLAIQFQSLLEVVFSHNHSTLADRDESAQNEPVVEGLLVGHWGLWLLLIGLAFSLCFFLFNSFSLFFPCLYKVCLSKLRTFGRDTVSLLKSELGVVSQHQEISSQLLQQLCVS